MSFTHGTPLDLGASTAEALNGTAIVPLNATLPAAGSSPGSTPSIKARVANLFRHMISELDSELRARKDGTLSIMVHPGRYRDSGGTDKLFEGAELQSLTDDATNYVYIVTATNTLTINTTGFPGTVATFIPIAVYVCAGGAISTEDWEADRRGLLRNWPNASSTSPTGTDGTSFMLDQDNSAGAGVDLQILFERGTDDSEDAAIEWDASAVGFVFRSQHSTLTRAKIDIGELYVGGALMVDSDGAAKVQAAVAGDGLSETSGVLGVVVDDASIEISADALQIKDGGVSAAKLSDAVADKLAQVSIGDAAGGTPRTVTIQVKDIQGNNLAEVCYLQVGVYQDADAAAEATDATIAIGATGTLVRSVSANKVLIIKTSAAGTATVTIADATNETIYVIAAPTARSKMLDCSDIGTVVIS